MINEAALAAVKAGREAVSQKELLEAVEVVIAGKEKKDRILGEEEKKIVSYQKGEMMSEDSIHFPDSLKFKTHRLARTVDRKSVV